MNGDQGVEDVEGDVNCLAIPKVSLASGVVIQGLTVDVLGDEVPVAGLCLSSPEHFHNVGMVDLPECPDLSTDCVVAGGVLKELERSVLALNLVPDSVNLRKPALAKEREDFESSVDDVSDRIVQILGLQSCRVFSALAGYGSSSPSEPSPKRPLGKLVAHTSNPVRCGLPRATPAPKKPMTSERGVLRRLSR
jgi:hypothetical protein